MKPFYVLQALQLVNPNSFRYDNSDTDSYIYIISSLCNLKKLLNLYNNTNSLHSSSSHPFPSLTALLVGNTDTRHFHHLVDKVYRFFPIIGTKEDVALIHSADERLSVKNLLRAAQFYHTLMVAAGNFANNNNNTEDVVVE